jgi:Glycosyl transferase family 2
MSGQSEDKNSDHLVVPEMKLVMTLLVRDEADIVSSNIDFHLDQGVDFIIATDNLSVDGTTEILRAYERRGVLHYIHQADDDHSQYRWVTAMARLACTELAADWVINNDADEFWCPEHGDLKQVLNAVPSFCDGLAAMRVNFLPGPMADGDFFADAMIVRECRSLNALGDPLPGKVCHRGFADIEVEEGNHSVRRNGNALVAEPGPITVLHFPMRSFRQFENKIAKGGAAYERNTYLPREVGSTLRHLYKVWQRGELEAYYEASVIDTAAIEHGLKEGRFVRDERVRATLSRLNRRSAPRN